MELKLVRPTLKYRQSFEKAWEESRQEQRYKIYDSRFKTLDSRKNEIKGYIKKQRNLSNTKWWWIIYKNEYAGRIGIRKWVRGSGDVVVEIRPSKRGLGLATKIGRLVRRKARQMGKKYLTYKCNKDNLASQKLAIKWGGVIGKEPKNGKWEYIISL